MPLVYSLRAVLGFCPAVCHSCVTLLFHTFPLCTHLSWVMHKKLTPNCQAAILLQHAEGVATSKGSLRFHTAPPPPNSTQKIYTYICTCVCMRKCRFLTVHEFMLNWRYRYINIYQSQSGLNCQICHIYRTYCTMKFQKGMHIHKYMSIGIYCFAITTAITCPKKW